MSNLSTNTLTLEGGDPIAVSDALCTEIDRFFDHVLCTSSLLKAAVAGHVTPAATALYLANIRHLLSWTPRHLRLAKGEAERRGELLLAGYFNRKILEEEGHAAWADADLREMGRVFGVTASVGILSSMQDLVDSLERTIISSPRGYLSHILFAEYFTVRCGPVWVAALESRCGIPRTMLTAITRHVALDQHHVASGKQEIDGLVCRADLPLLRMTLDRSMQHSARFFEEIHSTLKNRDAFDGRSVAAVS